MYVFRGTGRLIFSQLRVNVVQSRWWWVACGGLEHSHSCARPARVTRSVCRVFVYERRSCCGSCRCCFTDAQSRAPTPAAADTGTAVAPAAHAPSSAPIICTVTATGYFSLTAVMQMALPPLLVMLFSPLPCQPV